MTAETDPREAVILKLGKNRVLAHQTLFGHRHPSETPPFHLELIDLWHSSLPKVLLMAFRGGAKSTLSEEAILVEACLRQFKNGVILGESETRATERLRAIKHEIEHNPYIEELFGNLVGPVWTETRVILANGVIIQAYGRGQSLRGVKHLDQRPDRLFVDDLEDAEAVLTPEARQKWLQWFFSVVVPAMAPEARIRIAGTPLNPEALLMKLSVDQDWETRTYPIEYKDAHTGARLATWESRFPLSEIDKIRASFERQGLATQYAQEYMCQSEDPTQKPFKPEMFRVEPRVRAWEAVYAMFDPARTVKTTSASTGVAVWSWIANRLIIWDSYARLWKPDEIIGDMFRVGEQYQPVIVGIEEDGLNEFILQPLRHEQVRRGAALPVRPVRAPKGKLDFIRGLQPFFNAREVIFDKELPDLVQQLLSFPTGRIDAPNALAYALTLRPGSIIYDGFSVQNIFEDIEPVPGVTCYLAVNVSAYATTGVLVQYVDGALHVIADWAREGDPGLTLEPIVQEASIEAGVSVKLVAPEEHFDNYDTLGLRAAAASVPVTMKKGGSVGIGREQIRDLTGKQTKGLPALKVGTNARWTLNAFAGGYAREITRKGILSDFAQEGVYRTLMEGLESFASLMRYVDRDVRDGVPNYKVTPDGRRYISARE